MTHVKVPNLFTHQNTQNSSMIWYCNHSSVLNMHTIQVYNENTYILNALCKKCSKRKIPNQKYGGVNYVHSNERSQTTRKDLCSVVLDKMHSDMVLSIKTLKFATLYCISPSTMPLMLFYFHISVTAVLHSTYSIYNSHKKQITLQYTNIN